MGEGHLVSFYHVENQRLDARTEAWWLSDDKILIQIPGALEVLSLSPDLKLAFESKVPRHPGSVVLDILGNGDYLVEGYNDDEELEQFIWPEGDYKAAAPAGKVRVSPDTKTPAKILGGRSIVLDGNYDFELTPPTDARILQVISSRDGSHLFAIGEDHRILDWNIEELLAELERHEFR